MAYLPYDRNPSGIVYFGPTSSDQVLESNSNFAIDAANSRLKTPNLLLADGGKIGNASQTGILTLGSDGVATFSSGVVITGDLVVQGTQVILNTETLAIEDNIIVLNKNVTGTATSDAGIEIERGDETNVRLQWDEGNNYWTFTNNGSNYYRLATHPTAGSGLVDGGISAESRSLHVGAGNGISVAEDSVSVVAGTGIASDANGVHVVKTVITSRTELTTPSNSDQLLIYDTNADALKKITKANFLTNLGAGTVSYVAISGTDGIDVDSGSPITGSGTITLGLSNIPNSSLANSSLTLAGDIGSNQTVSLGDTLTITGGSGIVTKGQATDTLVIDLQVDNSTVEVSSDTLRVKDSGITEAKRYRSVDSSFSDNDTISSDINLVAGGAGGITVKLPSPAVGKMVIVKKTDSAAGTVTISKNNTDTIDGANSKILYYQYETLTFVSDGTNWFIV
jgi:hypothetical protein